LYKFLIGTIGFHAWTMFLFPTEEYWPHPDYDLKNLTRSAIDSRAQDFIYIVAQKGFLDNGENLPEEDGYLIVKIEDLLKRKTETGGVGV
jgi:hypothetical protein